MTAVSQLVRSKFSLLSPSQQSEITNLTFHATDKEMENSDVLGLIFRSNAYKTGESIGLFPEIARINHECVPNTSYYWNSRVGERIIFANRRISAGEELSDSYISLLVGREERQKGLEPYGFECRCKACARGGRESDGRRERKDDAR